ncbi:hypothetical protein [Kitasatospora sp. McL0602]|uniref:hypothetical protein n=1 Tax=Kitasatospora sp. McL0602 TaxID=3439530 RepID=UPI003F88BD35
MTLAGAAAAAADNSHLYWQLVGFAALSVLFYVLLRFAAAGSVLQVAAGVEHGVNLLTVGLLLPEYAVTRIARRTTGRPAPFAYLYGDAVCGAACAVHRLAALLLTAVHAAALRIGHREALLLGLATSAAICQTWW